MKLAKLLFTVISIAAAFAGGFGYGRWYGVKAGKPGERKILYYVDPMHPAYKSDRPGIAPDCGMKLEPVYADGGPAASAQAQPDAEALPAGTIQISPEKQQTIGVRYGTAEYTTADETIRAVGKVAIDETRVVRVHPKVEGWIEHVYVDFMGAEVRKGQPLVTLYSPEMLASQQEYLLALRARNVMRDGGAIPGAVANSDSLIEASRRRLELWDFSQGQIEEIERTGKAIHSITVFAPASGFVTARNSFPSQRATLDTELYAIADLSMVWVMADVFEGDMAKLHLGQTATVRTPLAGGAAITARVDNIVPQVDPQTRTLKIRLDVANPGMKLKPEMFVDVEFPIGAPRRLTVPVDAVLDSGQKQTVFVDRGNGNLEPRQVQVGERLGDRIVILGGLKAEERIVTSANFLIDSESQLKAAMSGMEKHD
jgi:RND family efflux transporter MFP subunit